MNDKMKIRRFIILTLLHNLRYILQSLDFLEGNNNLAHIFTVMDAQLDATVEDAVFTADGELVDIDTHLRGDDTGDIDEDAHTVDTLYADGSVEEQLLVHVPFGIEYAVAETGLQLVGHRTGTFVDFYLMLVIDIAQNIVAGNRVATVLELVLSDSVLADKDRLFEGLDIALSPIYIEKIWNMIYSRYRIHIQEVKPKQY